MSENIKWYASADKFVCALEEEAKADPKKFYGNKNLPADGRERVRGAIKSFKDLAARCEALNRGA